jgi:C-terminal processing protease CtpA/Prc
MFKGGAATKCGLLKVGDELVKVNGVDMAKMKHTEAWTFLKFLGKMTNIYLLSPFISINITVLNQK